MKKENCIRTLLYWAPRHTGTTPITFFHSKAHTTPTLFKHHKAWIKRN
uniref:Uncharacterized protein n=1 Tax=Lepeophtheirus salmonis TaxID=72036 RepID=A0A0K2UF35_LEPSM